MKIPEKISERLVCENPYRKIIEKKFKEKDGNIYDFLTVGCTGTKSGTMMFPITIDKKIILLKEFRVGIEDFVYNFPVGIQEPELSPEKNCKKELKEETGYSAEKFNYLGTTIVENYSDGNVNYYFAENCVVGEAQPEILENIEVLLLDLKDFEEMLLDGTINCPLSISCYTFAKVKNLL